MPYSKSAIEPFIREPGPVLDAVTAIGQAVMALSRPPRGPGLSDDCSQELLVQNRQELHAKLHALVGGGTSLPASETAILLSQLVALFELVTDSDGGVKFFTLMEWLSSRMVSPPGEVSPVWRNFCLAETYRAFFLMEKPVVALEETCHWQAANHTEAGSPEVSLVNHYYHVQTLLVRLTARAFEFSKQAEAFRSSMKEGTGENSQPPANGLPLIPCETVKNLVEEAAHAFSLVEEYLHGPWTLLPSPSDPRSFASLALAFYHTGIITIARLFFDPFWRAAQVQLPASQYLDHLEEHAIAALAVMEARSPFVNFESILFLLPLQVVALEVKGVEARSRVMALFEAIERKGLGIAKSFVIDIGHMWAAVANGRMGRDVT